MLRRWRTCKSSFTNKLVTAKGKEVRQFHVAANPQMNNLNLEFLKLFKPPN